jgi:hypothetical protein
VPWSAVVAVLVVRRIGFPGPPTTLRDGRDWGNVNSRLLE